MAVSRTSTISNCVFDVGAPTVSLHDSTNVRALWVCDLRDGALT